MFKVGIIGFIKFFVKEFVFWNIRVNVIVLGFIKIDMIEVLSDKVKEVMFFFILFGWFGEVDEVVNVVFFFVFNFLFYIIG